MHILILVGSGGININCDNIMFLWKERWKENYVTNYKLCTSRGDYRLPIPHAKLVPHFSGKLILLFKIR